MGEPALLIRSPDALMLALCTDLCTAPLCPQEQTEPTGREAGFCIQLLPSHSLHPEYMGTIRHTAWFLNSQVGHARQSLHHPPRCPSGMNESCHAQENSFISRTALAGLPCQPTSVSQWTRNVRKKVETLVGWDILVP